MPLEYLGRGMFTKLQFHMSAIVYIHSSRPSITSFNLFNLLPHLFEAIADHINGDPVVQALAGNELACFVEKNC